jgi:hypothetical protein
MHYARIEGTEVMVQVKSPAEAKTAIKELRHRKKELALLRKRLVTRQKAARAKLDKEEAAALRRIKKGGLTGMATRLSRAVTDSDAEEDLSSIEADLNNIEQITHNIESCILQIEGRLL